MSRSVNDLTLIGNVGKDPETRETGGGTKVAKLSLATTRKYKDQEDTQWHRVVFFGKLADVVEQYVKKGDRLYVRGRIEYSTSEHEGVTRYWTDVVAHELVMLGGSGERQTVTTGKGDDNKLPF